MVVGRGRGRGKEREDRPCAVGGEEQCVEEEQRTARCDQDQAQDQARGWEVA